MKVRDHVAGGVKACDLRLLMCIHLETSKRVVARPELERQLGSNVAAKHRINGIKRLRRSIAQVRYDLVALSAETADVRGRKTDARLGQGTVQFIIRRIPLRGQQRD